MGVINGLSAFTAIITLPSVLIAAIVYDQVSSACGSRGCPDKAEGSAYIAIAASMLGFSLLTWIITSFRSKMIRIPKGN